MSIKHSILEIAGTTALDRATTIVAAAATTSPFWLNTLSQTATLLLPILGCSWLVVQIVHFVMKQRKDNK